MYKKNSSNLNISENFNKVYIKYVKQTFQLVITRTPVVLYLIRAKIPLMTVAPIVTCLLGLSKPIENIRFEKQVEIQHTNQ